MLWGITNNETSYNIENYVKGKYKQYVSKWNIILIYDPTSLYDIFIYKTIVQGE